jgi:hypothetical protein
MHSLFPLVRLISKLNFKLNRKEERGFLRSKHSSSPIATPCAKYARLVARIAKSFVNQSDVDTPLDFGRLRSSHEVDLENRLQAVGIRNEDVLYSCYE